MFLFISTALSDTFLILRRIEQDIIKMYIGLHIHIYSTRYFRQTLIKLELPRQIFERYSNIKFSKNPSSWNRSVSCRQPDRQTDKRTGRQTDMMKLIDDFHNFANILENH